MSTQTGSLDLKAIKQAYEKTVAEVQPIYCRTNSSTAPLSSTRPIAKVTNTSDVGTTAPASNGNGWTLMHMARICSSNVSYKYLWTCQQLLAADGSFIGVTDIVPDNGTTVIDGDTITTGTINAARLDVYDATISKIRADAIDVSSINIGQSQVTNLATDLSNKASINAEYSVEIIPSNFNPAAVSGNLVTLTAKVTRVDGGSISGLTYQWFGDGISLDAASASATSYNVPYNTTYTTFTVEIN